MSLLVPEPNEVFNVVVHKYHISNPEVGWANSYEIQAPEIDPTVTKLEQCAFALYEFEKEFHVPRVGFDRYVISTYQPDGEIYNPDSFTTIPLGLSFGARDTANQDLDLKVCLRLRKNVQLGRDGYNLYRGALDETNVVAPAGKFILADPVAWDTLIDDAIDAANLQPYLLLNDDQFHIVMARPGDPPLTRRVRDILPAGVTTKKLNNKYFRKTAV